MSSVVIAGDTSGTITLAAPAVAGSTTLTLPATTGTLITTTGGVTPGTAGNVLTSNGTTWTSAAASGGGGNIQFSLALRGSAVNSSGTPLVFNSTGNLTWTAPTGVTRVMAIVIAGGGASGQSDSIGDGGGGGYGGYAMGIYTVVPGTAYSITVGAGGNGASGSGGSSSFASFCSATAGGGGGPFANPYYGGDGTGSSGNMRNSNQINAVGQFTGTTTLSSNATVVWGVSTSQRPGSGTVAPTGTYAWGGGTSGIVYLQYVGS